MSIQGDQLKIDKKNSNNKKAIKIHWTWNQTGSCLELQIKFVNLVFTFNTYTPNDLYSYITNNTQYKGKSKTKVYISHFLPIRGYIKWTYQIRFNKPIIECNLKSDWNKQTKFLGTGCKIRKKVYYKVYYNHVTFWFILNWVYQVALILKLTGVWFLNFYVSYFTLIYTVFRITFFMVDTF